MENERDFVYAGFWIRAWATIIDYFLISIIIMPILLATYGTNEYLAVYGMHRNPFYTSPLMSDAWRIGEWVFAVGPLDFLLSWVMPAFVVIIFWMYRQATPGKMAIRARIVDAETGKKPTTGQYIGRYFAYIPSILFFGIGIFWVGFDRRKQGWHDKLAGTVVVRERNIGAEEVKFKNQQYTSVDE